MKNLLLPMLLILSSLNADNTTMSEEDMINQIMKIQQEIKEEKEKTAKKRQELKNIQKLGKTVDKLAKKLGVNN